MRPIIPSIARAISASLLLFSLAGGANASAIVADAGWYTFCLNGGGGNPAHAEGCFINEGIALTGNTISFASLSSSLLQVTDAFISGENFKVVIDGTPYITPTVTPWAVVDVFNPDSAFANPGYSHGSWALSPGSHTVDIFSEFTNNPGPTGGGAAYVRAISVDVPPVSLPIKLAPRTLPPLPFVNSGQPIGQMPSPGNLISGTRGFLSTLQRLPLEAQSFFDKKVIEIGSKNYPAWLKETAGSTGQVLSSASEFYSVIRCLTPPIGPNPYFIKNYGCLGKSASLKLGNNEALSLASSLINVVTVFGSGIPSAAEIALLDLNVAIYGKVLAPALKQFSIDPIDPDYTSIYVPADTLSFTADSTGISELDSALIALLQSSFREAQFIDATNKSFDRYTAAYNAGDNTSALLQYESILYYLSLFNEEAQNNALLLSEVRRLLDLHGLNIGLADGELLRQIQNDLVANGFPDELSILFDELSLTDADLALLSTQILALDPNLFDGVDPFIYLQDIETASFRLGSGPTDVPEPGTLFLLGTGLLGLISIRRKLAA